LRARARRCALLLRTPPGPAVTTHTLFCLKTRLPLAEQQILCALLNSFVANYLVRLFVTTHVTASTLSRLRIPHLGPGDSLFQEIAALAVRLSKAEDPWTPEHAQLQAAVARAYELSVQEFCHVLNTFPLIPNADLDAALRSFQARCEGRGG